MTKTVCEKSSVLNQYAFYRHAPIYLQEEMFEQANIVKLKPGTLFFDRASRCEHIALVGAGGVRVYVVGDTGREITLYHVGPGETCPVNIISVVQNMDTPAIAVIEEPLMAALLPVKHFKKCLAEHDIVRQFIFESFAFRMVDILTLMEEISFRKMDQRLANFLSGKFAQSTTEPPVANLTHEKIAVELGSAREVISRLLRDFERKGVIELARGRIVRKDAMTLCDIMHS